MAEEIKTHDVDGILLLTATKSHGVDSLLGLVISMTVVIASQNDDADEASNDTGFTLSGAVRMHDHVSTPASRWLGGFRWILPLIRKGAKVLTAVWQPHVYNLSNDDPNINIYGEGVDDSVDFATIGDVVNRVRTTANTSWAATGVGSGYQSSPNIAAVVQEVIDRSGWAPSNHFTLITVPKATATSLFLATNMTTQPAKLVLTFVDPFARQHSMDAVLRGTIVKQHSIAAYLHGAITVTHSVRARLVGSPVRSHGVDATILSGRTHKADAILLDTSTLWYRVNAFLSGNPYHLLDAVLVMAQVAAYSIDAVLMLQSSRLHAVDAILRATRTMAHSIDANLSGEPRELVLVSRTLTALVLVVSSE